VSSLKLKAVLLAAAAVVVPASAAFAQSAPAQPGPAPAPAPAANDKREIVVTGQRDVRTSIDRRSYGVANDLQATTGSIADALRNIPSVEVDVQGNVSLRGDSSVTILVDGKPSGMLSGEGRAQALQQMPADQIERVEVMTNPSAAFSPDGAAGVINLITKKNRKPGKTGSVRANVGTNGSWNGGLSGSYSADKLTLAGDLGVRHDENEASLESDRSRYDPVSDSFIESRQDVRVENTGDMMNLRGSIDYDLTAGARLSGELRHHQMEFNSESQEQYEGENALGAVTNAYVRDTDTQFKRASTGATGTLRRTLAGDDHNFVASLMLEHTVGERQVDSIYTDRLPVDDDLYEEIRGDMTQDRGQLKLDYKRPLPDEARLETGYEMEVQDNRFDSYGARGEVPGALSVDANLTNLFLHEQTIHSAYGTYERPIGKLTVKGGLRLESVELDVNQVTGNIQDSNEYRRAYPSLHTAYQLTDKQQVTASYSKRVQRPRPEDLNPYPIYQDPFNYRAGNPQLEPQETDSYELGWQYRPGQTFYLATLYYRETSKAFTEVVTDIGGGVFLTTRENLAENRSGGLELVANGKFTPELSYNISGNLFWNEIDASALGFTEKREGTSFGGRVNLNWQPTPKDFFQLNAMGRGEQIIPQGRREPQGMLNLGYRRKVNDKLSFVVTAQNVLDTMRDKVVIDTPTIQDETLRRMRARTIYFGISYNFGDGQRRQPQPQFDFEPSAGPG